MYTEAKLTCTHTHFLYLLADSHLLLHLSSTCNLAAKSTEAYQKSQQQHVQSALRPKLFCVSADNIKILSNVAVLAKQTPNSVPWISHQRSHCGSLCLADTTLTGLPMDNFREEACDQQWQLRLMHCHCCWTVTTCLKSVAQMYRSKNRYL